MSLAFPATRPQPSPNVPVDTPQQHLSISKHRAPLALAPARRDLEKYMRDILQVEGRERPSVFLSWKPLQVHVHTPAQIIASHIVPHQICRSLPAPQGSVLTLRHGSGFPIFPASFGCFHLSRYSLSSCCHVFFRRFLSVTKTRAAAITKTHCSH